MTTTTIKMDFDTLKIYLVFINFSLFAKVKNNAKISLKWRSSFTKDCNTLKVVSTGRSSSIKGCLPLKVIFHVRSPLIKSYFSLKAGFMIHFSVTGGLERGELGLGRGVMPCHTITPIGWYIIAYFMVI